MNLEAIQSALREAKLDGWLFYDHHHRDPLAYRILGLSDSLHITRRWFYLIPAQGEPKKLVHRIEQGRLDPLPGTKAVYSTWQELEAQLARCSKAPPGWRCSTRRATRSCMSRWSMPERSKYCAGWARKSSAPRIWSAILKRC